MKGSPTSKVRDVWIATASLLGCGSLLGLSTNLSKLAYQNGINSMQFLTWSLTGAALILVSISVIKRQSIPRDKNSLKYYLVSAFFSIVGANIIFYSAVPHVGVSFVSIAITLPPILTYAIAIILRMETFNILRVGSIILALVGTSLLIFAKWSKPNSSHFWIIMTLLGPVLLAIGNIVRTTFWPVGAKPQELAPGMLLAALLMLLISNLMTPESSISIKNNLDNFSLILLHSIIFSTQSWLLLILQKVAGPVFLSLIGSVGAIIGIPFAMVLLDEPILPTLIPSASMIATGVILMAIGQTAKG